MTDPADRLAILRTGRDATPGEWAHDGHGSVFATDGDVVRRVGDMVSLDADHAARWDPQTTEEIVDLLADASDSWGAHGFIGDKGWGDRLAALLERLEANDAT